jgi:penicillin-binding protein 1C
MAPATISRAEHWLAYKTGTSYGFRDAWAVGYTSTHVLGVWVGRADGTPRPGAFGRNAAAPLLFKLFDLLPKGPGMALPPPPPEAIVSTPANLPRGLRRFRAPDRGTEVSEAPHILFPPNGAVLDLSRPDGFASLALEADDRRQPLHWIVNGQPIASNGIDRQAFWQPDGIGFAHITVIDAAERSTTVEVRIR